MVASLANDLGQLRADVRSYLDDERRLLIGGEWVPAANGATFPVIDPSSGMEIARVAEAGAADVDAAVAAARRAFEDPAWREMAPEARERLLWRLADLVERNADELGQIETVDNGMLGFVARNLNVMGAAGTIRSIGGWSSKIFGKTANIVAPFPGSECFGYTVKEPVGVVGAIIPWNVPLMLASWKLAPALAAGCTVVLKP
ncbi:MAG: aldehyde dehydrogenase family protein, partial [Rhodospirillaceae bacterium]|nr:aldehyde dehydrogenase family protein [Rhodospirillaceae bacterium]